MSPMSLMSPFSPLPGTAMSEVGNAQDSGALRQNWSHIFLFFSE